MLVVKIHNCYVLTDVKITSDTTCKLSVYYFFDILYDVKNIQTKVYCDKYFFLLFLSIL